MSQTKYHDLKYLPVDLITPNSWNAQEQDEGTFQRLVDEIKVGGADAVTSDTFIDAITVIALDDGKYRILGGEHRWMAAKAAGIEEIPCLVLQGERWKDEDFQKFVTVRLNALKGKVNPEKFLSLYNEMAAKYGREALQGLFGYTDTKAFQKLVGDVKKGMRKSLPKDLQKEFDEKSKDAKSVEDLSRIIQDLFNRYGDTLQHGFMIFTHGKQEHIYITMDRKLTLAMKKVCDYCRVTGVEMAEFMAPIVAAAVKEATKKLDEQKASSADPLLDDAEPTGR